MNFNKYAAKGNQILHEIARELGLPENTDLSNRMLRSTLHALRDRLTVEESFHLIAQLPFVLKAMYVDGWKYSSKPQRIKTVKEFVKKVIYEDYPAGHHDIQTAKDGENAVKAVLKVLRNHISPGEFKDILLTMPEDLYPLFGRELANKN
ncbi:DUF2267 domain-containing protein [Mangrovivirga sp. M17]|uniref:DUF2267 domain-containing protein n=1 Tax=Mangrovivirga halotolerans TaxID=2993936 RepID=A0ABT3RPU0_9BACT|nr:DUF2267 domain-containing protein [Mangrovivirga halotolerans]MCX2743816.1 DUF2267 domain-containing protein [Mangrovivirga halotolerans]